jgi:LasA protease
VALEGSPGFGVLSRQAPVLASTERAALEWLAGARPEGAATDYRTGMRLPFAVGQTWRYTGGPHQMSGPAWSSIDLAGGDGRVRAVRDGLAYTMCDSGGWLRVVHDRGFATDYYHLSGGVEADGRPVEEGDPLGRIGTDVSCGGSTTGPHVHFSLRRDGRYVDIDRYAFGKWSIRAGATPYQGSAWHGSRRVGVGGRLRNYGALGFTEGLVDTDGGGVLHRRAGPGTGHEVVGTLRDGKTVRVRCSARGTTHTGRGDYRSDLWNRLAGGGWVSDVYLWTGTGSPVAGWCG